MLRFHLWSIQWVDLQNLFVQQYIPLHDWPVVVVVTEEPIIKYELVFNLFEEAG